MASARVGKADSPPGGIITPINPTWNEAIAGVNYRLHPLFVLGSDEDDPSAAGERSRGTGPGSGLMTRPRWEYWTAKEKAKGHAGYVRRAEVMREDRDVLRREEEGENGDLMEDEHYHQEAVSRPSQWRFSIANGQANQQLNPADHR